MVAGPHPKYPEQGRPGPMLLSRLIPCALLLVSTCGPLLSSGHAQNSVNNTSGPWSRTNQQQMEELEFKEIEQQREQGNSTVATPTQPQPQVCTMRPYQGMSDTVSMRSLKAPDKVQSEYRKACTALAAKNSAESEKHLRKALQLDSLDPVGWVMLGRVLQAKEQFDQASDACSQAALHDPSYWPARLCLAEIAGHERKWMESLAESDRAVSLNLESKRLAYYVSAVALFNLDNLHDAESRALEAVRLDRDHQVLDLQLLVAKIDEVKGDISGAVTQLHEYLKYVKDSAEAELAKKELARLESKPK